MTDTALDRETRILRFLEHVHPYDSLRREVLTRVAGVFLERLAGPGETIYSIGDPAEGLWLIEHGTVEITDDAGAPVSILHGRNSFGERGLQREGRSLTNARATEETRLLLLPADEFNELLKTSPAFARFFDRGRGTAREQRVELATQKISDLMVRTPVTVNAGTTIRAAAERMRDTRVSCLAVVDAEDRLEGIVTLRDMATKAVAQGLGGDTPVSEIMTADPVSLAPSALGTDLLHTMLERKVGHVPVTEDGRLVGILTQTDLTRFQAVSSASMVSGIVGAQSAREMAEVTAGLPQLLAHLVGAGNRHEVVTRLITDIADAVTRRLLALAEERLGAPPVDYLWLACGSQGRQEQTGVSDQDNCLILDDAATPDDMEYFRRLATFVSDGLDTCGYFHCPGDMMATNPRWCQPLAIWQRYFRGWINKPDPEAQMLASVMFDLRPIGGAKHLFENLQGETLAAAHRNSIFVGHMIMNSLKHVPPLGLFRGFATVRSGEHKNELDMKMNGVVPVVDLARIYALQGELTQVNTRARLEAAEAMGTISHSGAQDLIDAYDLIAETRLRRQAEEIRAGRKPDNFMPPSDLSDFERSHLRDAFVVVRTMQSAVGQGKGVLG
ncbi:cyclic nucleotide-binding/CBS domain-containing protein [Tropicimonas sp. IMCC6043]|nr:cyclic nucleotide-binding/CBS domain-containing protein [Tropicimonas sp. IMCC6043]